MDRLKFLMVSTHYPPAHLGGDAVFVKYLSQELVRNGHEVHVLHSPYVFAAKKGFLPDPCEVSPEGAHVNAHLPALGRMDPLVSLVLGWSPGSERRFREVVLRLKPDVVHWHNTKGFIGRPIASPGTVSLYTAHDYYAVCPRSSLLRPGQRICSRPFLCQSCLLWSGKPPQLWRSCGNRVVTLPHGFTVISPSRFLAERLSRDGIRVDHVLRNFVPDKGCITPDSSVNKIVYMGILERFKGPMTLLEAFGMSQGSQGFELEVFGEGASRPALEHRAKILDLEDRVRFHGYVPFDDIKRTLSGTAAIIVPSESYENAPLAALEALSMGIPVIGTDIGGLPEILGPESGSEVVRPRDPIRLSEAIVSLWRTRSELPSRSSKARTAYELLYSPGIHLNRYMDIVKESLT